MLYVVIIIIIGLAVYFYYNHYSATRGMIRSNLNSFFIAKSKGMDSENAMHFMVFTRYGSFLKKREQFIQLYALFLSYVENSSNSGSHFPPAFEVLKIALHSHLRSIQLIPEKVKEELNMLRAVISLMHIYESGAVAKSPKSAGFRTLNFIDNFIYIVNEEYCKRKDRTIFAKIVNEKAIPKSTEEHKKVASKLLASSLMLFVEQADDILSQKKFSEIEVLRLRFCLTILNITSISWWVNVHERNTKNVQNMLDNMLEEFMGSIEKFHPIRIGDYIVDQTEKEILNKAMGGLKINDDTQTNYRNLLENIYNIRAKQYSESFQEDFKTALNKDKKRYSGPPRTVILLVRHFTGDEWVKNLNFSMELSSYYIPRFFALGDNIKNIIAND